MSEATPVENSSSLWAPYSHITALGSSLDCSLNWQSASGVLWWRGVGGGACFIGDGKVEGTVSVAEVMKYECFHEHVFKTSLFLSHTHTLVLKTLDSIIYKA